MFKKYVYVFILLQVLLITAVEGQDKSKKMDKISIKTADKITDVDGQVIKDDETGVSYHPASDLRKTEDKALEEVVLIRFYDTPQGYINAENERGAGNYDQAIILFEATINEIKNSRTKYRPIHLQYAIYGKALANVAREKYEEAVASYKQLLTEVPKTRFKKDTYAGWLDCCRKMKSIPALEAFLSDLQKDSSDLGRATGYNVRLAMAELSDPKTALDIYRQLATCPDQYIADKALLGQITCLEALQDPSSLNTLISSINVKSDTSPFILAVVYTTQGDIQFKDASGKKDKAKYHDALMSYLKAISLGFQTKEIESYYQRALFNAAICYQTLATMLNKEPTTGKYKKRAQALLELLIRDYPESEFAKKAKEMTGERKDGK